MLLILAVVSRDGCYLWKGKPECRKTDVCPSTSGRRDIGHCWKRAIFFLLVSSPFSGMFVSNFMLGASGNFCTFELTFILFIFFFLFYSLQTAHLGFSLDYFLALSGFSTDHLDHFLRMCYLTDCIDGPWWLTFWPISLLAFMNLHSCYDESCIF